MASQALERLGSRSGCSRIPDPPEYSSHLRQLSAQSDRPPDATAHLNAVLELASRRGIYVFSDEVYRELEHDSATRLPAACDRYDRALSLGSVSKTYGLPGLRLAWLASR